MARTAHRVVEVNSPRVNGSVVPFCQRSFCVLSVFCQTVSKSTGNELSATFLPQFLMKIVAIAPVCMAGRFVWTGVAAKVAPVLPFETQLRSPEETLSLRGLDGRNGKGWTGDQPGRGEIAVSAGRHFSHSFPQVDVAICKRVSS